MSAMLLLLVFMHGLDLSPEQLTSLRKRDLRDVQACVQARVLERRSKIDVPSIFPVAPLSF